MATDIGYKLVSYNTSWVNDCNNNQLHPNLSESASIVAKAKAMGKIEKKKDETGVFVDVFVEKEGPSLDGLRMALADTATAYIKSKMMLNGGADFIALIEQTVHVPPDSHANYDAFGKAKNGGNPPSNKQDLGEDQNKEFGILRRIDKLKLHDSSTEDINREGYNVVYDMVVNHTMKQYAGEGIGIAFHGRLMDTILTWNQLEHPVVQELNKKFPNVIARTNRNVHYYSDDLGKVVCFDETGKQVYYKGSEKAADLGRPIIMSAGIKNGTTLNVLVAAHGPNIFNLKFDTEDGQKQIKEVLNDENFKTQVDELFETVGNSIGRFINAGLASVTDKSALTNVEHVNVFFGGDMNDPRGQLLEAMVAKGLAIKVGVKDFKVQFNYNLGERIIPKNGDVSQYGYENLLSCCANADSIKENTESTKSRNLTTEALGSIEPKRIDGYPVDFFKPENFGYNGDYALFGSSDPNSPVYELKLDNVPQQEYEENATKVIASDHLPVVSQRAVSTDVQSMTGGGRRRTLKKCCRRHRRQRSINHKRDRNNNNKHKRTSRRCRR